MLVGIAPTLTVDLAEDYLAALGDAHTFTVEANGTAPLTYEWLKDNNATPLAANGASQLMEPVTESDFGFYRVL